MTAKVDGVVKSATRPRRLSCMLRMGCSTGRAGAAPRSGGPWPRRPRGVPQAHPGGCLRLQE
eukprot:6492575-Alexandrium_andersonii.AAC.1